MLSIQNKIKKPILAIVESRNFDIKLFMKYKLDAVVPYGIDKDQLEYSLELLKTNGTYMHHIFHEQLLKQYSKIQLNQQPVKYKLKLSNEKVFEYLNERETEVYFGVIQGKSNNEISEQLFLSENTIKNYVRNIFIKLGAKDRVQAIRKGVLLGFVEIK